MPKPTMTIEQWRVVQSVISPTYEGASTGQSLNGICLRPSASYAEKARLHFTHPERRFQPRSR